MNAKVELLDMVSPKELELIIQKYLDAGYFIQDSKLDMYQNTVSAVYYDEFGEPLPF